jgi:regulator of nucleoside diphosphate kinase
VSPIRIHDERTLTELDHRRIERLIRDVAPSHPLDELLSSARLVPSREVDRDIVTMYSQILVTDLDGRRRRKFALCYPDDAEPAAGFISVLSPLGTSLLGLVVGAVARWDLPFGREAAGHVSEMLFQPEANGDYTL